MAKRSMLVILSGLPGTGKTTIARLLSQRLPATLLRIDTIEQALQEGGADVGPLGYLVAYALARDMLSLGGTVIADSVNPVAATRSAWRDVAKTTGVTAVDFEIVCSDIAEHRRRVETRVSDIAGMKLPDWSDVTRRTYEYWTTERVRERRTVNQTRSAGGHSVQGRGA